MNVLGISAFYHDSAAALVHDGQVVAAAQEERFTRIKHDDGLPVNAIRYCLEEGGVGPDGIDARRLLRQAAHAPSSACCGPTCASGPRASRSFHQAMPLWLRKKLWIPYLIERGLRDLGYRDARPTSTSPSTTRATRPAPSSPRRSSRRPCSPSTAWASGPPAASASARATASRSSASCCFPHSLGLLYSAFTYYCGFRVNSGEYKLMGLAPYGEPRYADRILDHLIDLREDGSFGMNMRYFGFLGGADDDQRAASTSCSAGPRASRSRELTRREMDLAASIQEVTEEIVLRMARHAASTTGQRERVPRRRRGAQLRGQRPPAARGAVRAHLGAAGRRATPAARSAPPCTAGTRSRGNPREPGGRRRDAAAPTSARPTPTRRSAATSRREGYPCGADRDERGAGPGASPSWWPTARSSACSPGRMEFGPRALGHRSIIGDARSPDDAVDR